MPNGPLKNKRDELMALADDSNPMFWASSRRRDWLFGHDASKIDGNDSDTESIPSLPPQVRPEDSVYKSKRPEQHRASQARRQSLL